jgi:hypothetical protein
MKVVVAIMAVARMGSSGQTRAFDNHARIAGNAKRLNILETTP